MVVHYRTAGRMDAEHIAHLHIDSWRRTYRGSYRDAFLDGDVVTNRLDVWRSRLSRDRRDQFVCIAEADSHLLGFICVFGNENRTWGSLIDNLHVTHESRRSGIGTLLMQKCGTWLASHYGQSGVYLWVLEANQSARHFYERLGAAHAETMESEHPGGGSSPSCRYVWPRPEVLRMRAEALTGSKYG
ncbi:MAG: GNAT family N-acetyltransferase [Candidatus Binatus sp.]